MAEEAGRNNRWTAFLAGKPETTRFLRHQLRMCALSWNDVERLPSIFPLNHGLKELENAVLSGERGKDDGTPYDGLTDGQTLARLCEIDTSLKLFGYSTANARLMIRHSVPTPSISFDEALTFFIHGLAPHRFYRNISAYLLTMCGREDGLPPDLTDEREASRILFGRIVPSGVLLQLMPRERNPHLRTAEHIIEGFRSRETRLDSDPHDFEFASPACSWYDADALVYASCRYDHADMLAWTGKDGMVISRDTIDGMLEDHLQVGDISGDAWHAMAERFITAMDMEYARRPDGKDSSDDAGECSSLQIIIRRGLSHFIGGTPEELAFAETVFDMIGSCGIFSSPETHGMMRELYRNAVFIRDIPYAYGMLTSRMFDDIRSYGMPFAKEELSASLRAATDEYMRRYGEDMEGTGDRKVGASHA